MKLSKIAIWPLAAIGLFGFSFWPLMLAGINLGQTLSGIMGVCAGIGVFGCLMCAVRMHDL